MRSNKKIIEIIDVEINILKLKQDISKITSDYELAKEKTNKQKKAHENILLSKNAEIEGLKKNIFKTIQTISIKGSSEILIRKKVGEILSNRMKLNLKAIVNLNEDSLEENTAEILRDFKVLKKYQKKYQDIIQNILNNDIYINFKENLFKRIIDDLNKLKENVNLYESKKLAEQVNILRELANALYGKSEVVNQLSVFFDNENKEKLLIDKNEHVASTPVIRKLQNICFEYKKHLLEDYEQYYNLEKNSDDINVSRKKEALMTKITAVEKLQNTLETKSSDLDKVKQSNVETNNETQLNNFKKEFKAQRTHLTQFRNTASNKFIYAILEVLIKLLPQRFFKVTGSKAVKEVENTLSGKNSLRLI